MIYSKKLFWIGFVFIAAGMMGVLGGRLISGLGFFPLVMSAFTIYDKEDPKIKNARLRETLFVIGLVAGFIIWFIGPKIFSQKSPSFSGRCVR